MRDMERDMAHLDENNPKHMAHMMRKMQDVLPPDLMPKEMNDAIRRLEAGETPTRSRRTWANSSSSGVRRRWRLRKAGRPRHALHP